MVQIQDKGKGEIQYLFTGNLSVSSVEEMYTQLNGQEVREGVCLFQVRDVEHLDMSFFQVLYAFICKLQKADTKVNVSFQLDEEYSRVFDRSGLKEAFDQLIKV